MFRMAQTDIGFSSVAGLESSDAVIMSGQP